MKKLPQIPPKHLFEAPNESRYFDELPQKVRSKILEQKTKSLPNKLWSFFIKPQFSLPIASAALLIGFWWASIQTVPTTDVPSTELQAQLKSIPKQDIQNYLLEQNLSQEDIIDFANSEKLDLTAQNNLNQVPEEVLEEALEEDLEEYL